MGFSHRPVLWAGRPGIYVEFGRWGVGCWRSGQLTVGQLGSAQNWEPGFSWARLCLCSRPGFCCDTGSPIALRFPECIGWPFPSGGDFRARIYTDRPVTRSPSLAGQLPCVSQTVTGRCVLAVWGYLFGSLTPVCDTGEDWATPGAAVGKSLCLGSALT